MSDSPSPNERLKEAARLGDIGGIRAAVADGADDLGEAVSTAVRYSRVNAFFYLLELGADPNKGIFYLKQDSEISNYYFDKIFSKTPPDWRALLGALSNDQSKNVERLLKMEISVGNAGYDLLQEATKRSPKSLDLLLQTNLFSRYERLCACEDAVENGKCDSVKIFLQRGICLGRRQEDLFWAAIDRHCFDVVRVLLENGKNLPCYQSSAMMTAIGGFHLPNKKEEFLKRKEEIESTLRLFLDNGANPLAFDEETLEQLPPRNRRIVIRLLQEYLDPAVVESVGGPWWTRWLPKPRKKRRGPQPSRRRKNL
jgi:hypothetical protein